MPLANYTVNRAGVCCTASTAGHTVSITIETRISERPGPHFSTRTSTVDALDHGGDMGDDANCLALPL